MSTRAVVTKQFTGTGSGPNGRPREFTLEVGYGVGIIRQAGNTSTVNYLFDVQVPGQTDRRDGVVGLVVPNDHLRFLN